MTEVGRQPFTVYGLLKTREFRIPQPKHGRCADFIDRFYAGLYHPDGRGHLSADEKCPKPVRVRCRDLME